jgi:hypothetical protein
MRGMLTPTQVRILDTIRVVGCSTQGWFDLDSLDMGSSSELLVLGCLRLYESKTMMMMKISQELVT